MIPDAFPCITKDLPGIGGVIKADPAQFIVEEIPLYDPIGSGQHVYVSMTREGWNTPALQEQLAQVFHLRRIDVGFSGLKDRHARATQTFSLLLPAVEESEVAHRIEGSLPVTVNWVRRHHHKLRTGHLKGNRFQILVDDCPAHSLVHAQEIARVLEVRGIPNYYGRQRFGIQGENIRQGLDVLHGRGPRQPWLRRFVLSAYQAALFNVWLAKRIWRGWFDRLFAGDIAKKSDTGGLFEVVDPVAELSRLNNGMVHSTGPIYGSQMQWARHEPGELEQRVLEQAGITVNMLKRARLDGTRRQARLFPQSLTIESRASGMQFTMTLPKGAYATTVLHEFMKTELGADDLYPTPSLP